MHDPPPLSQGKSEGGGFVCPCTVSHVPLLKQRSGRIEILAQNYPDISCYHGGYFHLVRYFGMIFIQTVIAVKPNISEVRRMDCPDSHALIWHGKRGIRR
jgi:hypothetical protein